MNSLHKYNNSPTKDSLSNQINKFISKYNNGNTNHNPQVDSRNKSYTSHNGTPYKTTNVTLEEFKDQLKNVTRNLEGSPTPIPAESKVVNRFSDTKCQTGKRMVKINKSRQVSMNTNGYMTTDAGDTLSKQELTQSKQKSKKCAGSVTDFRFQIKNKLSFVNQTGTTIFTNTEEELKESDFKFNIEAFQKGVQDQQQKLLMDQTKIKKRLVTNDDKIRLRNNLRRKMKPVIEDGAMVPMKIFYNLITYDGQLLKKLLMLSKGMYKHLIFYLMDQLNHIPQAFEKHFGYYFEYQNSYISQTPISFCNESGIKIDYILRFKVKKECRKFKDKSVILSYQYKNQITKDDYMCSYQFDIFPSREHRWIWLHKDEALFHGYSDSRAYTIPIMPICIEDDFEISISLQSLMGSLDISSLKWLPMRSEPQPPTDDVRDYNRFKNLTPNRDLYQKYFADLKRVCEVEDTIIEWFNEQYVNVRSLRSHIKRRIDLNQYLEQFEVIEQEVGGIDFSVWKIQLKALKNPQQEVKYYQDLNMAIKVLPIKEKGICNEVKRSGFLIDRGAPVEVRGGDTVILKLTGKQLSFSSVKDPEVDSEINSSRKLTNKPNLNCDEKIIFEFNVDGMTCINCSQTIERAMKNEYSTKGLLDCQIAVLTHKMRITFNKEEFDLHKLTPEGIISEVEMVGFSAELHETIIDSKKLLEDKFSESEVSMTGGKEKNTVSVIKNVQLIITGMTCAACQNTIESHLKGLDGIISCSVSLLTHKASIQYQTKLIGIRKMIEEVEAIGFEARYEPQSDKADIRDIVNKSVTKYRRKFILSAIFQIPILLLVWLIPHTNPDFVTKYNGLNGIPVYAFLIAGFSTLIQVVLGSSFYVNAFKTLRNKSANMDVLIVLGTTAAWGYALALIIVGYEEMDRSHEEHKMYHMQIKEHVHNFEISSVLITIILLGKLLETISKKKTVDQLAQLASLKVTKANLVEINPDSSVNLNCVDKEVPIELIQVNDLVKVYPGSLVPVDGVVLFGKGTTNESMLTGESRPVVKDIGSLVFGGSIMTQGTILMKVKKSAENSSINQIIKMVENAQNSKAPIQGFADKLANYFVPIVILLSCIAWVSWFSYTYSKNGPSMEELDGQTRFQFAFSFGISTLVIACPCALGLATPTAVMVGTGVAASYGILIKGGDILEKINRITTVVFDKTGTLTSGSPQVKDFCMIGEHFKVEQAMEDKDLVLYLTYLTEKTSEHPLAKAIVKKIEDLIPATVEEMNKKYKLKDFKNRDGEGVVATISLPEQNKEHTVIVGNNKIVDHFQIAHQSEDLKKNIEFLEKEGNTVIQMIVDGVPQLVISLQEAHLSKPESKEVVNYLKNTLKLKVKMITGDNKHAAYKVARHVGIEYEDVVYQAYPEDKKKTVEKLQSEKQKVMFIGDGINDSPVLAQAEVGVAINSGSDITVDAADIVLMKDNLCDVINALQISKKSFRRIKINFVWAFMYNLLLVPIAMGILYPLNRTKLDPMLAGAAMALSSISVVVSSLLLKIYTPFTFERIQRKIRMEHKRSSSSMMFNASSQCGVSEIASQMNTEINDI